MLERIGVVAWWLGAIVLSIGFVVVVAQSETSGAFYAGILVLLVLWLPLWALAFILGGSFWRPPKI